MTTTHTGDTSGSGRTTGTPSGGAAGTTGDSAGGSAGIIVELSPCLDPTWPADLILDRIEYNWEEWNRRLNLVVDQLNYSDYLDGSFPCPDPAVHPGAARIWELNDRALRAFMLLNVSDADYDVASKFTVAHDVHDALRKNYENPSMRAQVDTMMEALGVRFSLLSPLNFAHTLQHIDRLYSRYTRMGNTYHDILKMALIFNALNTFPQLQSTIEEMLISNPAATSADVENCVLREEQVLLRREKLGLPLIPGTRDNTALAAVANRATNSRPVCANCKRTNHRTEFCISPGGKMAGKRIDEARKAQRAALGKPPSCRNRAAATQDANTATANTTAESTRCSNNNNTITINGKRYTLVNITAATQASR
jgi:hypothetical protein